MTSLHDVIFDSNAFDARVIYAGTLCSGAALMNGYPAGCLHFVRAGVAELMLPGKPPVRIDTPSLVFFANNSTHGVHAANQDGVQIVCAVATFDPLFTRALTLSFPSYVILPLTQFSPINHTLEAFFLEAQAPAPESQAMAGRLCMLVLAYLTRHLLDLPGVEAALFNTAADKRIAASVVHVHQRYSDEIDLETLAAIAGMSRTRFVERFTELVGQSPHQYLIAYRMLMAKRMLKQRVPVKVVANRVGYRTVPAFVRTFKSLVGVTPGTWTA